MRSKLAISFLISLLFNSVTLASGPARVAAATVAPRASLSSGAGADGAVYSIAVQSDGKSLIGGDFTHYNGQARGRLARLNGDGSLDTAFLATGAGADGAVAPIAMQGDGKIMIGGGFTQFNGVPRGHVARLNSDGSLDNAFLSSGAGADSAVVAIAVQSNGKIMIGGAFSQFNGVARGSVARLNSDGSLDTTFLATGAGPYPWVFAIAVQSDGKILIGGDFWKYNGVLRGKVARLNSDGSLDTTFLATGTGANSGSAVEAIAVQGDGKILIGGDGHFTNYNGVARGHVARLNSDGSLDTTFLATGVGSDNRVSAIAVQSDGKIVIGGWFYQFNGVARSKVARLNSDGSLDTTFLATGAGVNGYGQVDAMAVQSDGKILIGGDFLGYNNTARAFVARLNGDGSLDTAFPAGGGPGAAGVWEDISDRLPPQPTGARAVTHVVVKGSKVWAAGPNTGILYRSGDSGAHFIAIDTGLLGIADLIFFDELNGLAFTGTKCARTSDGGTTWSVPVTIGYHHSIAFATPLIGYAGWQQGVFYRTGDGGATWEKKFISPSCCDILDLAFPDPVAPGTGYMVIANGGESLFKTTDGGTTWLVQMSSLGMDALDFVSPGLGWTVGGFGEIFGFNDGLWTKQVSNAPFNQYDDQVSLMGVSFLPDGLTGWVVGYGGTILHTTDGGQSWLQEGQALNLPSQTVLTGIAAVSPTLAFASGYPASAMGGPPSDTRRLFIFTAAAIPLSADVALQVTPPVGLNSGGQGSFTIKVTNNGPMEAPGPITVAATLAPELSFASGAGQGWSCSAASQAVTCSTVGPLASSQWLPDLVVAVEASAAAVSSVSQTFTVSSAAPDPNEANNTVTVTVQIHAVVALAITTTSPLPAGLVGQAYSQAFTATGGAGSYSWSVISGSLPAGLLLSSGGVLSGNPVTAGNSSFTVQVTDAAGSTSSAAFTLQISAPLAAIPMLSEWGRLVFFLLVAVIGFDVLRRIR